eukprot:7019541-Pyramimonas_sp.AAC.1
MDARLPPQGRATNGNNPPSRSGASGARRADSNHWSNSLWRDYYDDKETEQTRNDGTTGRSLPVHRRDATSV